MAKLDYIMVCESVSVDAATNRLSLFLIANEQWPVSAFPHLVAQLAVVSSWHFDGEDQGRDFQVCSRITLPDGQTNELRQNVTPATEGVLRSLAYFIAVNISGPGPLTFHISLNGQLMATKTIDVRRGD
jgi:hypothetical protein